MPDGVGVTPAHAQPATYARESAKAVTRCAAAPNPTVSLPFRRNGYPPGRPAPAPPPATAQALKRHPAVLPKHLRPAPYDAMRVLYLDHLEVGGGGGQEGAVSLVQSQLGQHPEEERGCYLNSRLCQ